MRTIAKLGAVLVTAVALLAPSAWAVPGNGNSGPWTYYVGPVWDWHEPVPCLGSDVTITGVIRGRFAYHTTPQGMKSFVDQWFMEEGDLVLTVESTGKQYLIKAGRCGKENGQGVQDPSQYGGDKGENNYQFVFVAEDGDRVVLKARFRWEGTGDPANPRIYFGFVYEWSCH